MDDGVDFRLHRLLLRAVAPFQHQALARARGVDHRRGDQREHAAAHRQRRAAGQRAVRAHRLCVLGVALQGRERRADRLRGIEPRPLGAQGGRHRRERLAHRAVGEQQRIAGVEHHHVARHRIQRLPDAQVLRRAPALVGDLEAGADLHRLQPEQQLSDLVVAVDRQVLVVVALVDAAEGRARPFHPPHHVAAQPPGAVQAEPQARAEQCRQRRPRCPSRLQQRRQRSESGAERAEQEQARAQ